MKRIYVSSKLMLQYAITTMLSSHSKTDFNNSIHLHNLLCSVDPFTSSRSVTISTVKQSHNAHMEAQGERMYSSYSFTTSAPDGVSGQLHALASLYPWGKNHQNLLCRRWAPEPVWTQGLEEKSLGSAGYRI
jgi:hypothetical protein